jgi:uncharacterized protein
MQIVDGMVRLAATDLANHVGCGHRTSLELQLARDGGSRPSHDPLLDLLAERGRAHEEAYAQHLTTSGRTVERATDAAATLAMIQRGADVIAQASLEAGMWQGRPDFLVRVEVPSELGAWSYEIHDAKLAAESRAGAVLQLCVYSDLLSAIQVRPPSDLRVIRPGEPDRPEEPFVAGVFRFDEYAAIFRALRADLEAHVRAGVSTAAEPVSACDTCAWFRACDKRWHDDDHLALVAGGGRPHRRELTARGIETLTRLAREPLWRPERGAVATYEKLGRQASLQLEARTLEIPPSELLPVVPGRGFELLPPPSPGDMFFDLEGDPFIDRGGREYLFGWAEVGAEGELVYHAQWAMDAQAERAAFVTFVA